MTKPTEAARPIFREAALSAQRERWLGEALTARRLSLSFLTVFAVAVAATVIVFVCCGEYTRKARVDGYLEPSKGLIKVFAPQTGTIVEKLVTDGQTVAHGDPLVVVSSERSTQDTSQAHAAIIDKLREQRAKLDQELTQQAHIDTLEADHFGERLTGLASELAALAREARWQRERIQSARTTLQRYRKLSKKKFVADLKFEQQREVLLDQELKLQAIERARIKLERKRRETALELRSQRVRGEQRRSQMQREIARVEQQLMERKAERSVVIRAPADGTVTTVLSELGQWIDSSSPLLSILPIDAELKAQLLVPSRSIGFIGPEREVALRYEAFPHARFGSHRGRIEKVSNTLIMPREVDLPVSLTEPVYRATVVLDAQSIMAYERAIPLKAGMRVEADIALDRRRIIEWLFEPILSIRGRLWPS